MLRFLPTSLRIFYVLVLVIGTSDATNYSIEGSLDSSNCAFALSTYAFQRQILEVDGVRYRSTSAYWGPILVEGREKPITAPLVVLSPPKEKKLCVDLLQENLDRVKGAIVCFPLNCSSGGGTLGRAYGGTRYAGLKYPPSALAGEASKAGAIGYIAVLNYLGVDPAESSRQLANGYNPFLTIPSVIITVPLAETLLPIWSSRDNLTATIYPDDLRADNCRLEYKASFEFYTVGIPILFTIAAVCSSVILILRIRWQFQRSKQSGGGKSKKITNLLLLQASLVFITFGNIFYALGTVDVRGYKGIFSRLTNKVFEGLTVSSVITSSACVLGFWVDLLARKDSIWTRKRLHAMVGSLCVAAFAIVVINAFIQYGLNDETIWTEYIFAVLTLAGNTSFIICGSLVIKSLKWSANNTVSPNSKVQKRLQKLSIYLIVTGVMGYAAIFVNALITFDAPAVAGHLLYPIIQSIILLLYNIPLLFFLYVAPSKNKRDSTRRSGPSSEQPENRPPSQIMMDSDDLKMATFNNSSFSPPSDTEPKKVSSSSNSKIKSIKSSSNSDKGSIESSSKNGPSTAEVSE